MSDGIPDCLPAGVAEHLGYYVYLYVDPRTDRPFYVGKGKGQRILAHFDDPSDSSKTRLLAELRNANLVPRLEILAHGLQDEEAAFRIEAAAIDLLGLGTLSNAVRGWRSLQTGRMTLSELASYYTAPDVEVIDPVLLIRINRLYRHNMPADELYDVTRGVWRLGIRREGAKYALALFEGIVREVYSIREWHPAHTTRYQYREEELDGRDLSGRWEFEGEIADGAVRTRYRGGSVRKYLTHGQQNPVSYVNV